MLASDVNNPEFQGAHDPTRGLFIEFQMYEAEDWNKSQELGRKVKCPPRPYIYIQALGDKTTAIHRPADDLDKHKYPTQWMAFQIKEGLIGGDAQIPGWKLDDWPEIDHEQLRELKHMRFQVVEQIAGASDEQVQKMGMGGLGLREKARQAMRNRMGAEVREELAKKDAELADMKRQMEELRQMVLAKPDVQPEKKKGGRPKGSRNKPKPVELAVVDGNVNG